MKTELSSADPEDEPSVPLRVLARPLASEATRDREPLRDLNSEFFPAKPEAEDSEAVRDRESELFSAKLETKDSEPLRDLKSELFSARFGAKPSEPVKALARPLV